MAARLKLFVFEVRLMTMHKLNTGLLALALVLTSCNSHESTEPLRTTAAVSTAEGVSYTERDSAASMSPQLLSRQLLAARYRVRFINEVWPCVTIEIRRGNRRPAEENPLVDVTSILEGKHADYPNTGEDYFYRREADPHCADELVWSRWEAETILHDDKNYDFEIK